jgi:hypothetical protein
MVMATRIPDGGSDFGPAGALAPDQDVLCRVERLPGQDSRRHRTVWPLFLSGDGGQLPAVVPIDDVPERPDPQLVGSVCHVIADDRHDPAPERPAAGEALMPAAALRIDPRPAEPGQEREHELETRRGATDDRPAHNLATPSRDAILQPPQPPIQPLSWVLGLVLKRESEMEAVT